MSCLGAKKQRAPASTFLFGSDPESGDALAYIGEAEVIRERLKQHKAKDFGMPS